MSVTADKTSPAIVGSGNGNDRPRETEWMTAAEAAEYAGGVGFCTIRDACNRNTLRTSGSVAGSPDRSGRGGNGSPIGWDVGRGEARSIDLPACSSVQGRR